MDSTMDDSEPEPEATPNMMMPHQCQYCEMAFARQSNLTAHLRLHTGKQFTCEFCEKSFVTKQQMSAHVRVHTGEKPFVCNVCDMSFAQKGNLTRHTLVHTGEKPHTCIICDKSFSEKHSLKRHLSVHTGHTRERCDVCGKSYSDKLNLARHQTRMHTMFSSDNNLVRAGIKPHTCEDCGKSFSQQGSLLVHMFTHTGERPHPCKVCGKAFSQKGSLKRHMMVHTGAKPYACTVCGRCFSEKGSVKKHMTVHGIMYDMAQMEATGSYVRIDETNVNKRIRLSDKGDGDLHVTGKEIIKQRIEDLVNLPGMLDEDGGDVQDDTDKEEFAGEEPFSENNESDGEDETVDESMPGVSFTAESGGAMYLTGNIGIAEENSDKSEDESGSNDDDFDEGVIHNVRVCGRPVKKEKTCCKNLSRKDDDEGETSDSSEESLSEDDVDQKKHFLDKNNLPEPTPVDIKVRGRYFNVGSSGNVQKGNPSDEKPHAGIKSKKHFLEKDSVDERAAVDVNRRGMYFDLGSQGDANKPNPNNQLPSTVVKSEKDVSEKCNVNEQNLNTRGTYFNVGSVEDMSSKVGTSDEQSDLTVRREEQFFEKDVLNENMTFDVNIRGTYFNVGKEADTSKPDLSNGQPCSKVKIENQSLEKDCVNAQTVVDLNLHGDYFNVPSAVVAHKGNPSDGHPYEELKRDKCILETDSVHGYKAVDLNLHGRYFNAESGVDAVEVPKIDPSNGKLQTDVKRETHVFDNDGLNASTGVDVNISSRYMDAGTDMVVQKSNQTNAQQHADVKYEEPFSHKEPMVSQLASHDRYNFNIGTDRHMQFTEQIHGQQHTGVKYAEPVQEMESMSAPLGTRGAYFNVGSSGDVYNTGQMLRQHHPGVTYEQPFLPQGSMGGPIDMHGGYYNMERSGRDMANNGQFHGHRYTEKYADYIAEKDSMNNHVPGNQVDIAGKQFMCYVCDTPFSDKNVLAKHMQVHILEYTTHM